MNLRRLQKNWDKIGRKDPWSGCLRTRKGQDRWDPDEFFASGQEFVENLMIWLTHNHVEVNRQDALDFGCGIGRVTQALAEQFDSVVGVDIAPSMIENAEQVNPLADQCQFILNAEPNLFKFEAESFDFICSVLVFQHIEPRYMIEYLKEFARLLRPGGAIAVQIPEEPVGGRMRHVRRLLSTPILQNLVGVYRKIRNRAPGAVEMYGLARPRVQQLMEEVGLQLVRTSKCSSAGPNWSSYRYLAIRQPQEAPPNDLAPSITVDDVTSLVEQPDPSQVW